MRHVYGGQSFRLLVATSSRQCCDRSSGGLKACLEGLKATRSLDRIVGEIGAQGDEPRLFLVGEKRESAHGLRVGLAIELGDKLAHCGFCAALRLAQGSWGLLFESLNLVVEPRLDLLGCLGESSQDLHRERGVGDVIGLIDVYAGRPAVEDADGGEQRVRSRVAGPGRIPVLAVDAEFEVRLLGANLGRVDVGEDRVIPRRARAADLLEHARITGFARTVVAIDDRDTALVEGQALSFGQGVDVLHLTHAAERDSRGRCLGVTGMLLAHGLSASHVALADGLEHVEIVGAEFALQAEPPEGVLLPERAIFGPSQDVGEGLSLGGRGLGLGAHGKL